MKDFKNIILILLTFILIACLWFSASTYQIVKNELKNKNNPQFDMGNGYLIESIK